MAMILATWMATFVGGVLVGLGLRRSEPPRWWERPWPVSPAPEPSFGERIESHR